MNGFINLNKPVNWTSHDCVAKVRKILRTKKVGHGGTLDPAATGVLPIAVGKGTRLLQYLPSDKAYLGTVRFGVQTTTDDLEGDVIASQSCGDLSLSQIESLIGNFIGDIRQIPPSYSAIQVDGKRLYELARKGEIVEVPGRNVQVFAIDILDWRSGEYPELDIHISCGAGTYIRAIARDLGYACGKVATLAKLQRTVSSGFHLADSITLEDLQTQVDAGNFQPLPADFPLQYLPLIHLHPDFAIKWCHGQKIPYETQTEGLLRVYENNVFLGIARVEAGLLIPKMVFV